MTSKFHKNQIFPYKNSSKKYLQIPLCSNLYLARKRSCAVSRVKFSLVSNFGAAVTYKLRPAANL